MTLMLLKLSQKGCSKTNGTLACSPHTCYERIWCKLAVHQRAGSAQLLQGLLASSVVPTMGL